MTKTLSKTGGTSDDLYAAFRPAERLTLMLNAMARRDHAEVQRLCHACPCVTYRTADAEFMGRSEVAFDTAAVVAADLQRYCGALASLRWTQELVALAQGKRQAEFLNSVVARAQRRWAAELAVGWHAFGRFCRTRVGVEPDVLLSAWKLPGAGEVTALLAEFPGCVPAPSEVDAYFERLCELWDGRFGSPEGEGVDNHGR